MNSVLAILFYRLTIGYINFLAEIVSKDKNPDEVGNRQAAAPQQKKVVVHSAKGKRLSEMSFQIGPRLRDSRSSLPLRVHATY